MRTPLFFLFNSREICYSLLFLAILPFSISADPDSKSDLGSLLDPGCGMPVFADTGLIKKRAVWMGQFRWKQGQTIPVYFKNGTQEQKMATEHCAREWERYGNFQFDFKKGIKTSNELAINIEFARQQQGVSGWSYVGAGTTDPSQTSMSFSTDYKGENACSTILHEFGHALGLHHEQYNPAKKNSWIPAKAYSYFQKNMGWTKKQVDDNILMVNGSKYTNYTKADPLSVMGYYFPGELFKSGKPMGLRFGLSQGDIEGIQKMYPGRPKPQETKPIFLYFKDSNIATRTTVRNGKLSIYANGQLLDTIESTGGRNVFQKNALDGIVRKNNLDEITYSFQSNSKDFAYWFNIEEEGNALFGFHCDPNTICDGYNSGFFLTHVSNGNRGQHSNYGGSSQVATHTSTTTTNTNTTVATTTTEPTNPELNSNLIYFCYEGKVDEVKSYLNKGADPNTSYEGWTPLLYAAYLGHDQVVLELLKKNANVSATYQGWTARMLAEENGHSKIVEMIDAYIGFQQNQDTDTKPRSLPKIEIK